MSEELTRIFNRLRETADFSGVNFSDVNACSVDGDNALHCVVRWGDLPAAKALIAAGIDVNKAGDLGYTPLHVACMKGNVEMVKLLTENGADVFAMSEGDVPFAAARLAGNGQVCDMLRPMMEQAQLKDRNVWVRSRVQQLTNEIRRLEKLIR